MSSLCQQIKIDYEQLQALKDEFFLEYEKAKETGKLGKARTIKIKWEEKYNLLKKKLGEFLPGEVYNFIMELRDETNEDIQSCVNIHFQPNGDLAGGVQVNGVWYPFHDNEIIKTIAKEKIGYCYNIHTQPNNDLAGKVKVNGVLYPFHGNEIIKTIAGEKIEYCDDIHTQLNGDLAGRVQINGVLYPFHGNEIIKTIAKEKVESCDDI